MILSAAHLKRALPTLRIARDAVSPASVRSAVKDLISWLARQAKESSRLLREGWDRPHVRSLRSRVVTGVDRAKFSVSHAVRALQSWFATDVQPAATNMTERLASGARKMPGLVHAGLENAPHFVRTAWSKESVQGMRLRTTTALENLGRYMPGPPVRGLQTRLATGLIVAGLLVFGVGGWMVTAQLASAVVASGLIVVDSNVKKVQHPTGGVVGTILVRNGDRVDAQDVLMRLDETQTRAALGIIVAQLIELQGRKGRLLAERDDLAEVSFADELEAGGEEARRVIVGERRLFEGRRKVSEGQKAQLKERVGQLRLEIEGLTSQRDAKAKELTLVREELARVEDMYKRNLLPVTRVLAMQREEIRIAGEHGALVAQIARANGQIAETELNILSLDQTRVTDAQKELREVEGRIAELSERRLAADDQLKRIEIRSPQAGIVHDLNVHTVGGVIAAGEPIMQIVPTGDQLAIEVRIAPYDIDQIALGQKAVLRFPAFNQATTPEFFGTLAHVAADLTRETQTGRQLLPRAHQAARGGNLAVRQIEAGAGHAGGSLRRDRAPHRVLVSDEARLRPARPRVSRALVIDLQCPLRLKMRRDGHELKSRTPQ